MQRSNGQDLESYAKIVEARYVNCGSPEKLFYIHKIYYKNSILDNFDSKRHLISTNPIKSHPRDHVMYDITEFICGKFNAHAGTWWASGLLWVQLLDRGSA